MTPPWDELAGTFLAALEVPPERRDAWLDEACASPELRSEVEAMLRAHEAALSFEARLLTGEPEPVERTGTLVGPYRLQRLLGRGGMGEVYLAERADGQYEGVVAIKLLPGGDAREDREQRLRHERQILASLRHPGISSLLDGGVTADGRPYLVMEHVDGEPIDVYCDRHRLTLEKRLQLFARVCDAVQYAHGRLVVHRDIKPSNLLVTADGSPKLLDFGIAKLLDPETGEPVVGATRTEMRLFTPLRAAPEQIRGETISTATDVYALGVLLFELLTGALPFRRSSDSWEAQRAVCEDEPLRPAAALGSSRGSGSGEEGLLLAETSAARQLAPAQLRRQLRGDLESVVVHALTKDPAARYASAGMFAEEVRRYLRGEPVLAPAQTWLYRAGKFVRRHALPVAATTLAGAALVSASLVAVVQARRAARERDLARSGERRAQAAADVLVDLFSLADPSAGPAGDEVSVRELLDRAERRALALADPALAARLLYDLGRIQRERTDYRAASRLLERAAKTAAARGDGLLRERIELELGIALRELGDRGRAKRLLAGVLASRQARLGASDAAVLEASRERVLLEPWAEQLPLLTKILAGERLRRPPDPIAVADTLDALGGAHFRTGDVERARSSWQESLALLEGAGKGEGGQALAVLGNLAIIEKDPQRQETIGRRQLAAAIAIYGAGSLPAAETWNNLGVSLASQGRLREAEEAFTAALTVFGKRLGEEHGETASAMRNVGRLRQLQGRTREALPLLRRSLAIAERHLFPAGIAAMRLQVERAAWEVDPTPRALASVRAAAQALLALSPHPTARYRADALTALGLTLLEAGRACEAVEQLGPAVAARGGLTVTTTPGYGLEARCALRVAEEACGLPIEARELRGCAADLPKWGLADRRLLARLAAR